MTAAQFVAGSVSVPVFPGLAKPRKWSVKFRFSLRGEAPEIARETVEAVSEATAIKAGLVKRLGGVNRALHSLEMLEVCAL